MKPKHIVRNLVGTIIAKIITNDLAFIIPGKVFENDKIVAFYHPQPNYKIHILIVPKRKIVDIESAKVSDLTFINEIFVQLPKILKEAELQGKTYSLITNAGKSQHIKQLHFHLVSN